MKPAELHDMTDEELKVKELEIKAKLFNLCFQKSLQQVKDVSQIKKFKRDIARIKTIVRERRIGIGVMNG